MELLKHGAAAASVNCAYELGFAIGLVLTPPLWPVAQVNLGIHAQTAKTGPSESHGQLIFMPEVSNLITSVNQLMSHNFELLKMAKVPGNDIGMGQRAS